MPLHPGDLAWIWPKAHFGIRGSWSIAVHQQPTIVWPAVNLNSYNLEEVMVFEMPFRVPSTDVLLGTT